MSKKLVLLFAVFLIAVFISGCISDTGKGTNATQTIKSDYIPQTNLPAGFTYKGIHETVVNIGGSSMDAIEGVYRYNNRDDVYIQAIEDENPEALIARYKSELKKQFKDDYNPFQEVSLNGHTATQLTDYPTIDGKQKPQYTVIWPVKRFMIIVGPSPDAQAVIALAAATGS